MAARLRRWIRNETGAVAAEFALVLPAFIALTVGTIYMGILGFAYTNLQSTAQIAARCASVRPSVCFDQASVATYAASQYRGPGVAPAFTYTVADCGHQVTATASMTLVTGLPGAGGDQAFSVTACHP